ncbi:carbohydrate binding domain-containing protein [Flavobacterium sp. U410]
MKHYIFFCILSLLSLFSNAQNMVKNGSFEQDLQDWNGSVATVSPYDKKVGKNSCMINQFTGKEWKGIDQTINIPKDTYALQCSIWIKTDAISGGANEYNAGIMTVEFMTSSGKNISYENIAQVKGTTPWTEYKQTLLIPAEAKKIRIMLALAQTEGTILFDEVKINKITEDEYLSIMQKEALKKKQEALAEASKPAFFQNGDFESQLEHWAGKAQVTDKSHQGQFAALISSSTNEWTAIDQAADLPEGAGKIHISGWLKAENIVQGKENWNNGMFIIEFTKDGKNKTSEDQLIGTVTGSNDWLYFEKTLSIPKESKKFRIMLALSNCTGKLYVDNIQIKYFR